VVAGSTRLADTGADYAAGVPTALSGLSLTWGRDGPQSQPEVGACTFTVADKQGDADFLGTLKVGAPVTVYATTEVDTGTPADAAVDPGFASDLNWRLRSTGTVSDDPGKDALAPPGHAARIALGSGADATVPVAPFTAHPGGWIGVPRIGGPGMAGQQWAVTMRYRAGPILGPGAASWQYRYFTDSAKQGGAGLGNYVTFARQAGAYVTVGGVYTVPANMPYDRWIGLGMSAVAEPSWATVTPAALTWAQVPAGSWADVGAAWVDEFHAVAPPVTYRRATVAYGRITDLAASAAGDTVRVDVTASDWTADLANQSIGAAPWLAERLDARAARIASYVTAGTSVAVDARCAALLVSWLDVDNQPAYGLFQDLATTGDGILWPRLGTLWIEDPDTRAAVGLLGPDPISGAVVISGARGTTGGVVLDSCDVLRDGLTLEQTVEDVVPGWRSLGPTRHSMTRATRNLQM
jgi:hypothetical protein